MRSVNHHHRTMFTLTSDNCFESAAFCAWWNAAHSYQLDHNLGDLLGIPDDGWALDCLLESYLRGLSPTAAVEDAIKGYDPTPDTPYDCFH